MKKIFFYLALLAGSLSAQAQQPGFLWAKSLGGSNQESASKITTDASGNVYTIGGFYFTADFDPGPASSNLTSFGSLDIYISKLDASGNFLWARQIGSTTDEYPLGISVDAAGNIYTTGWFDGITDFDPGQGTYTLSAVSIKEQFILKLDAGGNFVWAKQIGVNGITKGISIGLDATGNVYTAGTFSGTTDFDGGIGTYTLASQGNEDFFVLKTDAGGNFVWANSFGSSGSDFASAMAIDASGTIYLAGRFAGTVDFDPSVNSYTLASVSGYDMFVSVMNGSGNLISVKQIGDASGIMLVHSLNIDAQNNIYVSGLFVGTIDFDPSSLVSNLSSLGNDAFILKLNAAGQYVWAKNVGGANANCFPRSIKADAGQNVYITGYYDGAVDFDPGPAINTFSVSGPEDAYLLKLDATGNFIWVKIFGGIYEDAASSVALDQANNIYFTGYYKSSCDFDPTAGNTTLSSAGGSDVFIVKLHQSPVSLKEETENNSINIFPNPATNQLAIHLDEGSLKKLNLPAIIEIYNSLGQLVIKEQLDSQNSLINIKDLCAGIYVLNITGNEKIVSKKIIVKQ